MGKKFTRQPNENFVDIEEVKESPLPEIDFDKEFKDKQEKKKITRQGTKLAKLNESNGYPCSCCGKVYTKQPANFFFSQSTFYKANNHYLTVCKPCMYKLLEEYTRKLGNEEEAIKRICLHFDVYVTDSMLHMSIKGDSTARLSYYMRASHMVQYSGKTYDTYLAEQSDSAEKERIAEATGGVTQTMLDRWGDNVYTDEELKELDKHYKMLKSQNPNIDSNQEIFIKDLSVLNMLKLKALKTNDSKNYLNLTKEYRETFKQTGLKTVVENENLDEDSLGITLATISKYTPEEYYKDKNLYKDYDGLGDYLNRHLLRPLKNLILGTKEKDSEYNIEVVE